MILGALVAGTHGMDELVQIAACAFDHLRPGGWLLYETFTVKQAAVNPRRSFRANVLLQPDELRQAFESFEILSYAEGLHNEKATAQLLAKKPMGSTP